MPCYRNGAGDLRGSGDRDVWGHWGNYYGRAIELLHVLNPSSLGEIAAKK
jgi:hypothetical protein